MLMSFVVVVAVVVECLSRDWFTMNIISYVILAYYMHIGLDIVIFQLYEYQNFISLYEQ